MLSEEQIRLLERFSPELRERHIEAPHTGSVVAVETFFVGTLKGVGKVYLQTDIDCHSRYGWARLYPNKMPVTAVHLMNHDVLPTFEAAGGAYRRRVVGQWARVLRAPRPPSLRAVPPARGHGAHAPRRSTGLSRTTSWNGSAARWSMSTFGSTADEPG